MSWFKVGQIVMSLAGHDKGLLHVVTAVEGDFVALADGKHRRLASPKRKNVKHIQKTNDVIQLDGLTDRALRKILQERNGTQGTC